MKVAARDLLANVLKTLPPGAEQRRAGGADGLFVIDVADDGGYRLVEPGAKEPFCSDDPGDAIGRLRRSLLDYVAQRTPEHVLVSGAAVVVGSHAIVLLGDEWAELPALVDALVEDGATRYGDGYVPIDLGGRVHPATLPPPAADDSPRGTRSCLRGSM